MPVQNADRMGRGAWVDKGYPLLFSHENLDCNNTWRRRVCIGFFDLVWRDQPRVPQAPRDVPAWGWSWHTRSGKTLYAWARTKVLALLLPYGQSSNEAATPIQRHPTGCFVYTLSNDVASHRAWVGRGLNKSRSCLCGSHRGRGRDSISIFSYWDMHVHFSGRGLWG